MTLPELVARLQTRRVEADVMKATAPVAEVLGWVLAELVTAVPSENGHATGPTAPDPLLTPQQVAARLGVSRRFVYAHREQLGGRALSRRALRFPESAVSRYLSRRP